MAPALLLKSFKRPLFALAVSGLLTLTLSGCGVGTLATATQDSVPMAAVHGTAMGGSTPIKGAQVELWQTGTCGYGASSGTSCTAPTVLAGPVSTQSYGTFTFSSSPAYTCTSGSYIYITATGGDTTDGLAAPAYNPNLVLMAALGNCADFASGDQSGINIFINELSTVAAAYALGNFISVSENGASGTPGTPVGTQQVYIGAPAANSAATGSCTNQVVTSGHITTAMSCTSAGLAHAFQNAINLVNASNIMLGSPGSYSANPNGTANTTVSGNSSGSVPQAMIDTLGNIMQYCTNSGNATSTDSTMSSECSTLFTDSKPTGIVAYAVAPVDTLSAMINVAHQPYNNVGATCTGTPAINGGLFCLTNGIGAAFTPNLSGAPHDWSIAIVYTATSTGATFGSPQVIGLDANDNVYVQAGNAYAASSLGLTAMTNSGGGLWSVAQSAKICAVGGIAVDNNGYVWISVPETTTATGCTYAIYGYSTSAGALTYSFMPGSGTVCDQTTPTSTNCPGFTGYDTVHNLESTPKYMAFDRFNNLWYARNSNVCAPCVMDFPYTSGSPGTYGTISNLESTGSSTSGQMIIDSNANIWTTDDDSTADGDVYLVYNTATAAAPAYTATTGFATAILPADNDGGIGMDSSGNIWAGSDGEVTEFTPTPAGSNPTSFGTGTNTAISGTHPYISEMDGGNRFWSGNFTSSGAIYVFDTPTAVQRASSGNNYHDIQPCYVPAGGGTCNSTTKISGTQYYVSGDPKSMQIDSAGSMWLATAGDSTFATGYVVQILGSAYPTWPQYSYGVFGQAPQ
jgi:hypothetical protein